CMLSQAGASLVLEKLKGKSIQEIQEMPPDIVRDTLGKKLVSTRPRCAMLGFNTLKNAVKQWQRQQTLSEIKNS
ncbi:MAG: iron-sulfur cluster assembly scaffold protein, partial [Thermodesulfobacteriota bacterium]